MWRPAGSTPWSAATSRRWDIAAGILLVREAGGFIADCDSEANPMETGNIAGGNADLLPLFKDALKGARSLT